MSLRWNGLTIAGKWARRFPAVTALMDIRRDEDRFSGARSVSMNDLDWVKGCKFFFERLKRGRSRDFRADRDVGTAMNRLQREGSLSGAIPQEQER